MEIPSAGFLARKACLHDCSSQFWRAGACPNFSVDRKGDSLDCREGTFFRSALPFHAFFPLNTSECCIASGKRSLAIIWNGRFSRKLVSVSSMNWTIIEPLLYHRKLNAAQRLWLRRVPRRWGVPSTCTRTLRSISV